MFVISWLPFLSHVSFCPASHTLSLYKNSHSQLHLVQNVQNQSQQSLDGFIQEHQILNTNTNTNTENKQDGCKIANTLGHRVCFCKTRFAVLKSHSPVFQLNTILLMVNTKLVAALTMSHTSFPVIGCFVSAASWSSFFCFLVVPSPVSPTLITSLFWRG